MSSGDWIFWAQWSLSEYVKLENGSCAHLNNDVVYWWMIQSRSWKLSGYRCALMIVDTIFIYYDVWNFF